MKANQRRGLVIFSALIDPLTNERQLVVGQLDLAMRHLNRRIHPGATFNQTVEAAIDALTGDDDRAIFGAFHQFCVASHRQATGLVTFGIRRGMAFQATRFQNRIHILLKAHHFF